jgi:hypothetical protein
VQTEKEELTEEDVAEVDRRYQELVASGRLSEEKLRKAFDRLFPSPPVGPPIMHACSLDFPEVVSEAIDVLCGTCFVFAEEMTEDLDQVTCVHCLRMIAEAGEQRGQEGCGLAFEMGRAWKRPDDLASALQTWVDEMAVHLATGIHPPADATQARAVRLMELRIARHRALLAEVSVQEVSRG